MRSETTFERHEIKYLLTEEQAERLKNLMQNHMKSDSFGNSIICNIYLDTKDYLLIRRSIEKPVYKEKLRYRSYGIVDKDTIVFCELKKKYNSVVYKRRISLKASELEQNLVTRLPNTQIGREIAYCFSRYENLSPKIFLSYEREAYYGITDDGFRITLDRNILWRDYDLSLTKGAYGSRILEADKVLLEVKTMGALPLWLVKFLSKNKIYKTSFSKYGSVYTSMLIGNGIRR
ncbi:MAG: polyphosphate polymerase domain-containing protein [Roseburia sp.]|nr:polyphosphate polymerase domain-containing protein [Anaeroplasma bactoclasticum]MCM1196643.1 polyphosphate polymerase domain-containing protein [Roseburia sp.]MCM1557527.1 polyphosphate polymerase domain-containing protein [Anaeroplasma bactoclasticum]